MNRKLTNGFCGLVAIALLGGISSNANAQTITHVPLYTVDGLSVSSAGDINGDGRADLIVGDTIADEDVDFLRVSRARVLAGNDGSVLFTFLGNSGADRSAVSVSGAGDVNGDGTPDLIVGAINDNTSFVLSGSARVYSGSDGTVLHTFNGNNENDSFGRSVSGVGDVNGDGRADLIVGAPSVQLSNTSGSAYVFSGSDGSVLYNFNGDTANDFFGLSTSGAGDVNGDGTPDLIVGAPLGDPIDGMRMLGCAQVLSGSDGSVLYNFHGEAPDRLGFSVSGVGDLNDDGRDDLIVGLQNAQPNGISSGSARVLSGSDGSVLFTFNGDNPFDRLGWSVSGAGDVNADGTPDLIVGAPGEVTGDLSNTIGSVRVMSGVDGSVLYTFDGDNPIDLFGRSVSGAGDVNGDGIDDFVAGADGGGYVRVFVSQIIGDVNQDGLVNFLDIAPFISILAGDDYLGQADTNEDGVVNFLDISPFIGLLSS